MPDQPPLPYSGESIVVSSLLRSTDTQLNRVYKNGSSSKVVTRIGPYGTDTSCHRRSRRNICNFRNRSAVTVLTASYGCSYSNIQCSHTYFMRFSFYCAAKLKKDSPLLVSHVQVL